MYLHTYHTSSLFRQSRKQKGILRNDTSPFGNRKKRESKCHNMENCPNKNDYLDHNKLSKRKVSTFWLCRGTDFCTGNVEQKTEQNIKMNIYSTIRIMESLVKLYMHPFIWFNTKL
ncbi:hypothetical protein PPYR_13693 [Photinus pyralis]|uniref:Uncharacterized protein n=1 Tax=Photinus pyralis TaxID=7054 RepID=A0A1Y1MX62_PHOPY|nr:hypothetical protein PPYR_13693 [Photinus pyralis]